MITSETIRQAALSYAARGWPVFPVYWIEDGACACGKPDCQHPGKHPIGKLAPKGRNSATTDSETIKKWWEKYPRANIGIPTGPESGIVALDNDPRHGGDESKRRLERRGNFPYTSTAHTGGKGEHTMMAHPGSGVKIKSRPLPGYPGIDIKADGGYIVAPPSNHISGGSYSWKIPPDNTPLAKIPDWLMALLIQDDSPQRQGESRTGEPIPEGQRNGVLTSLAGTMRRRSMSYEGMVAALLAENQRCDPPLPEHEVLTIAKSVARYDSAQSSVAPATASKKTYLPVPPPFPIEVLPASCQRAIAEIQRAHGVPVEIPGCAFLGTTGACIGRARALRIKQGWVEHPNLWLAIVAPSGYGKSPAVREVQRPIFALEKKWFAEYQEALKEYTFELEQRRLTPKDERSSLGPPPDPPEWEQIIVDDTTTEALTDALNANPRGILWNRDELAGLLHDLDKYAKKEGGTKARMMSSYDSGPWKVNRREASKRAFIPHATLSIFGTIQPKALPTIFSDLDAATGFLPRFIFVSPSRETPPLWTDETVSATTRDYLSFIFQRLLALDFDEQGEPIIIGVDREAKALYETWFNKQALETWQSLEASIYEAVLAKLRGQCLRIALILHCLEAIDEGRPDIRPVSAGTMDKAITLANFFKIHQLNAWQSIVNQEKVAELPSLHRQVARAILSLESEIVSGMLATAKITVRINHGLDQRFHVSADSVGRAAKLLQMTTGELPDRSGRGFRITPEDLQRLKSYFSETCVVSVESVQKQEGASLSEDKISAPEVLNVSREAPQGEHFQHLPDTCKNPEKPHEQSISDTFNTSDTSLDGEKEILTGVIL